MRLHRRRNLVIAGAAATAAVLGLASVAAGEPGNGTPEMQVLPSPIGVSYGQTVQVKGDDLPEGSGLIAATICGYTDAAGQTIPQPTADDCAGADELGRGLVVLQENTDGTFDQPYTLPASGETFGKNARACDATHYCALVLADANPDAPAYYIPTELQFTDQAPRGGGAPGPSSSEPVTTTTAPPPPTASTSAPEITVGDTVTVTGEHWVASDGDTTVGFVDAGGNRTTPAVIATVDANGALSAALTARFDDVDATSVLVVDPSSDPATHRISLPITVHPEPGVSGRTESDFSISEQPHVQVRARVIVTPPAADEEGAPPLPEEVAGPVGDGCAQLAEQLAGAGADPTALTTGCNALTQGGGGAQLAALLRQPGVLCLALAPAAGGDPRFTEVCNQVLGSDGAGSVTPPVADGLLPVLGQIP